MKYYKVSIFYRGKQQNFIIKSLSKVEAIHDAKKNYKGLLVKIEEIPMPFEEKVKNFKLMISNRFLRKKLNYPNYISAIRELAILIKAGISLKDALKDIGENSRDKLVKELFLKATEAIDSGKTLSDVFAEYEKYVGNISLTIVRLGERTGDLVNALNYLADIYENIYENRKKMIKALRYPIITLIAIVIAFVLLILLVVPKFKTVFEQFHAKLPLPTRILLGIENVIANYGFITLTIILSIIFIIIFSYKNYFEFRVKVDKILLKTPLIGQIIEYGTLHRFLLTLSSLLRSGIPLLDALKISEEIIKNEIIKSKIRIVINGINQGKSLSEMLETTNLINYIALRMISAGEESGELDSMLEKAAKYYEDRFQDIIDNMQASIEPIMLTIIGGLVLLIALGIFLPMWDLANAAKNAG